MQKCSYCGADLPENSRFCGKCGSVQDAIATDESTIMSNTPQPQYWAPEDGTIPATRPPYTTSPVQGSAPAWSPNELGPETPPPVSEDEDEDERRRAIPPWSPLYDTALGGDALLGSGQAYTPGAPVVQGTPQIGSVPSVAGSPTPYTNAPAQGAANASAGQPAQGAANASAGQPVQGPTNVPVNHPVQGPTNVPVSHPVQGPTNTPYPQPRPQPRPQPPGTHGHRPPHKHHEHQTNHTQHMAAHATKAAGGSVIKTIIIVMIIVVVVVAGGIGVLIHFLAHPDPLISISSNYKVGNTLAGANGTVLHISGQQFSSNSAITFLLDGHAAPGNPGTRSDANGKFSTDITITNAWSVGTHTLAASDASNNSTKNTVSVMIVQPGQANTPGPNGAPPDDATFTLNIPVNDRNNTVNQAFTNNDEALHITGHPDPAGGTVCLGSDNGQQFNSSYVATDNNPFTETYSFSCQGSYKSGKISYTETLLTDVVTLTDGSGTVCTLISPQLNQQVTGSYTGNGSFTGTWTYGPLPNSDFSCTNGFSFFYSSNNGTWTGTVSGL